MRKRSIYIDWFVRRRWPFAIGPLIAAAYSIAPGARFQAARRMRVVRVRFLLQMFFSLFFV
jgi:hypothetical protein